MTITVGLVDDDARLRRCLTVYLSSAPDIEVAFAVDSGSLALQYLQRTPVDVLLSDIVMPDMSGIELLHRVQMFAQPPVFLGITAFDKDETMSALLASGAGGYIVKSSPPAQIIDGVRAAYKGGVILSPDLTARFVHSVLPSAATSRFTPAELSEEEQGLVTLLRQGKSNQQIAHALHYALPTVKKKLSRLYRRLGVSSRYEIIASQSSQ